MHDSEFSQRNEVRTGVVLGGSQVVDGGSLVSTLSLASLQAQASSDTVPGQPGWECPGPVLKDA